MSMFYCNRCDIMEDSDEVGYVTLLNNEATCESEASDEEYIYSSLKNMFGNTTLPLK